MKEDDSHENGAHDSDDEDDGTPGLSFNFLFVFV